MPSPAKLIGTPSRPANVDLEAQIPGRPVGHWTLIIGHSSSGVALIIVLAFIVLLAGVVVAFFSRAVLDRQISNSSASMAKTEIFAQGAADQIIGDLKQEIIDGSTSTTTTGGNIYAPKSGISATIKSTVMPVLVGSTGTGGLANLIKRSANGQPFYDNTSNTNFAANGPSRAANISTVGVKINETSPVGASLNGRFISQARWNKPLLMPTTNTTDFTPPAVNGFIAPDWILVARNGSNPTAWSSSMQTSASNASTVVGRYAYNIYNEGGLLDINVAGYPINGTPPYASSNSDPKAAYKIAQAFADLSQLPEISALTAAHQQTVINALVGWRNYASISTDFSQQPPVVAATPSGSFPNYTWSTTTPTSLTNFTSAMLCNTTGFLKTANPLVVGGQTDRMFVSRQELIQLLTQGVADGWSTAELANLQNSLKYLTHFSRCLNQPTYWPDANRPKVPAANGVASGGGGSYTGGNSSNGLNDVYNPIFRSVRVTTQFSRNDGSIANIGDPLVNKRFALNRLAWITYKGASADLYASNPNDPYITQLLNDGVPLDVIKAGTSGTNGNIYKYFGLTWTPGPGSGGLGGFWIYDHGIHSGATTLIGSLMDPSSTSTPKDVQSAGREPDFFELLKAAVTAGAIAKTKTSANGANGTAYNAVIESTVAFQIFQLGVNIIDQANPTQYPTHIEFNYGDGSGYMRRFYGSMDLPYFYMLSKVSYLQTSSSVTGVGVTWPPSDYTASNTSPPYTIANAGQIVLMCSPTIWDPYDVNGPGGPAMPVPAGLAPSHLRIAIVPAALTDPTNIPAGTTPPTTNSQWSILSQCKGSTGTVYAQTSTNSSWTTEDSTALNFENVNSLYREPTVLLQSNVPAGSNLQLGSANVMRSSSGATGSGITEEGSNKTYLGFHIKTVPQVWSAGGKVYQTSVIGAFHPNSGVTVRLEYDAGGNNWKPYQEVYFLPDNSVVDVPFDNTVSFQLAGDTSSTVNDLWRGQGFTTWKTSAYGPLYQNNSAFLGNGAFDPRSTRWGDLIIKPCPPFTDTSVNTIQSQRPTGTQDVNPAAGIGGSVAGEGWTDATGGFGLHLGATTQNLNNTAQTRYTDPDGVMRRAMGGLVNTPTPPSVTGLPMATPADASSRPIILHRPFLTVAELGYVFSDTPWRNIDFSTSESGYAPLLDLFCINENSQPDAMIAGKVDLNGRQAPVFQSLLMGAYRDAKGTPLSPPLTQTEAQAIAQALVARTTSTASNKGPLANISELAGRYVAGYSNPNGQPYDGFSEDLGALYSGGTSSANNLATRFHEASLRAFSNTCQAGTWNLMIDLVAQTGRYPAAANSLSNFIVEGERRYWIHVAIDRQTGKVIDEQTELVEE